MEALENLVKSDAFFPVILILLVVLLVLFCYFITSNRKRENLRRSHQEQPYDVQEEIVLVENKPEVIIEKKVPDEELPLVNIPIPEMDDSEFIVEDIPKVQENLEEQVIIPVTEQVVEAEVPSSEIVNIEVSAPLNESQDIGESIEIPVVEKVIETPQEQVQIETVATVVEEEGEPIDDIEVPLRKATAFDIEPTEDITINENIMYEDPREYIGEKTEVFDFPDFSELNGLKENEDIKTIDVDEEIIKTANNYISSIMSK